MSTSTFKMNNPGCSCCDCPCACYRFDGNADDSTNSLHLTATNAVYDTGKLNQAATFPGTAYFERADNACFNLGPSGINVWFWLKADHTAPYSWGIGAVEPEGVIPTGDWKESSPTSLDVDGEWGIFFDAGSPHPTRVGNIWFLVGNGSGDPYDANQINRAATEEDWEFYFFWVSISEDKLYVIQNDASTDEEDLTGTQTLTSSKTLYVGNNTEGKKLGEQTNGGGARPWLIDNVGFCKNIGTKAEMEERAANLYNDGSGLPCNNAGLATGGCCG